jgi:hypothetical protein
MATVDDVARAALSAVGANAGLLQAIRWVSDRYRQLANRGKLRALRRIDNVVIPAAITDGLATFTRGSDIVTGDATAQQAWVTGQSTANADDQAPLLNAPEHTVIGRFIRYRRVWYRVKNLEFVGGVPRLRLSTPVAEDSTSLTAYKLVQRHTRMPKNARFFGGFVQQRLWRPLTQLSLDELNLTYPERLFVAGTGPEVWTVIGDDEDGARLIEFYPYPTRNEAILFTYYERAPELKPGMTLPDDLDVEALKIGVLIDICRFEMANALRMNQVDVAGVWRNESARFETLWMNRMDELFRVDRSDDDIKVILHTQGPPTFGDFTFIRTARQDAISRLGNFP